MKILHQNLIFRTIAPALQYKAVRYIISGGLATAVDIIVYFITYNFIIRKKDILINSTTISGHIASLIVSYSFGMFVNFIITRYFVFTNTNTKKRVQIPKYILVSGIVFLCNYAMMKMLVDGLKLYPTPARIFSAAMVAFVSYFIHKYFTFKIKNAKS